MSHMPSFKTSSLKALQYLQALRSKNGSPLHIHQQLRRLWKSSLFSAPSPHHRRLDDICNLYWLLHPLRSSSNTDSFLDSVGPWFYLVAIRQHLGVGPTGEYSNRRSDYALFSYLTTCVGSSWLPSVSHLGWNHHERIDEMDRLAS